MIDDDRTAASTLLNTIERERGDSSPEALLSDVPPHLPVLFLDEDGTIRDLTDGARSLLGYSSEESIDPNFFSHVHGKNLRRVMRDLAYMATGRKQRARWLLRLQTGNRRWCWYRAQGKCLPGSSDPSVRLLLRRQ